MAEHRCVDCLAMPATFEEAFAEMMRTGAKQGRQIRPERPRLIDARSTPRRPRCTTHYRAAEKARKTSAAAKRSRARSGLDEDTRQAVIALQGGLCPCGARLVRPESKRYEGDADHDHALAAAHEHPENVACGECFRGFLCRRCNRDIVGRLSGGTRGGVRDAVLVIGILRALADYMEFPPMARLRAERGGRGAEGGLAVGAGAGGVGAAAEAGRGGAEGGEVREVGGRHGGDGESDRVVVQGGG